MRISDKENMFENNDLYTVSSISDNFSSQLSLNSQHLKIDGESFENKILSMLKQMEIKPTFKHKCNSCGGTLDMDIDNHIFICPYCGSVYAVGTTQING